MKYAILPHAWPEATEVLDAAGYEHVGLADADFLLFNGAAEEFPDPLPDNIGFVQVPFAGVDHLLDVIRATDVPWSNAAGLYDATVAESTLALLLSHFHAYKRVGASWDNRDDVEAHTRFLIDGATIAVVGAGGIGKRLIELLEPFDARIIAVNRSGRAVPGAETWSFERLDEVWAQADVVVLLVPLTPQTRHMVGEQQLRAMKQDAVLVNVGRGALVDTEALVAALEEGEIAGACLDVTDPEPLPDGHPLWEMPNVVISPHVANPPYSVRRRIGAHTVQVAEAFAAGLELPTRVDPAAGY